jgi:hypothetical protein
MVNANILTPSNVTTFYALKINSIEGFFNWLNGLPEEQKVPALKVFNDNGLLSIVYFDASMAYMDIVNVNEPKEVIRITSPLGSAALKGCHEVQNIGACETYQRRYLWVAALEIVEHDALDSSEPIKAEGKPTAAKPVTVDVWDSLPNDEREFLQSVAIDAIALLTENRTIEAVKFIDSKNLDADEKVALWSRFNSAQRSAMKKAKQPTTEELINTI